MPKTRRIYKARLAYFFICNNCGRENSQTYKRKVKKGELCRNCRRNKSKIPENQMPLL